MLQSFNQPCTNETYFYESGTVFCPNLSRISRKLVCNWHKKDVKVSGLSQKWSPEAQYASKNYFNITKSAWNYRYYMNKKKTSITLKPRQDKNILTYRIMNIIMWKCSLLSLLNVFTSTYRKKSNRNICKELRKVREGTYNGDFLIWRVTYEQIECVVIVVRL